MANAQLKLSRRALLGAACALPLTPPTPSVRFEPSREAIPSGAQALRPQWQEALTTLETAHATVAALEGDPDEDAFDAALAHFNAALRTLLATPAPDIAALAAKLHHAVAAELAEMTYAPPALAQLAADADELALRSP